MSVTDTHRQQLCQTDKWFICTDTNLTLSPLSATSQSNPHRHHMDWTESSTGATNHQKTRVFSSFDGNADSCLDTPYIYTQECRQGEGALETPMASIYKIGGGTSTGTRKQTPHM